MVGSGGKWSIDQPNNSTLVPSSSVVPSTLCLVMLRQLIDFGLKGVWGHSPQPGVPTTDASGVTPAPRLKK
jgi:hypothetical protein